MNSYKKLCTEFYDMDKPNAPTKAFEFYLHYAQQAKGSILEPMCGSGRFLLPLLEHGFSIDGVDASDDMLQACRENGKLRRLTPNLFKQFLHQLELPQRYDLVIIPAGSFCLITDPLEIQESLRRLYAHMVPGATFVLEIERLMPRASQDEPWGGRWVNRSDGAKIVISWLSHYNPTERVSHSLHRYELIKDGQLLETEWEEFDVRLYEIGEFSTLLESAGFTTVRTLKGYGNNALDDTDDSIAFECVRP
jgi:SAM-dependent methyltransferase